MKTIHGPYAHGARWRLRIREKGQQRVVSFPTIEEAEASAKRLRREAEKQNGMTVGNAIAEYETHLGKKGNKAKTIKVTLDRLRCFLDGLLDEPLPMLTAATGQKLQLELDERKTRKDQPLSVTTKAGMLNQGRTFLNWCRTRGWMKCDILAGAKVLGKRRKGKPQLRIDEARLYEAKGREFADRGDIGAIAALVPLYMGPRAGEVVGRRVRDLDDGGRLLWIENAKTEAGNRAIHVPEQLRPYLLALAQPKAPTDLLFSGREKQKIRGKRRGRAVADLKDPIGWLRRQVHRLCKLAGVPIVGPHGLRGTHGSLAVNAGATAELVAVALGHESATITRAHYIKPGTEEAAQVRRAVAVLTLVPSQRSTGTKAGSSGENAA